MNPHFFTAPFCFFVSHLSQLLDTGKQRCGIRNYFKHLDRKIPEWGFFILPVFRKTEEIIAGIGLISDRKR